jgi:hypothetical protein
MGAVLARGLEGVAVPRGVESAAAASAIALSGTLRLQFAAALHQVFVVGTLVSCAGLIGTMFLPHVDLTRGVRSGAGEELLAAEMANLEPDDEPMVVPE